jgi:chromosome segregation ATPase
MLTGAVIGGATKLIGGLFGASKGKSAAAIKAAETRRLQGELRSLEKNRQEIVNPYAGVTSLADMATDLSDQISNPFANLSVATQAAEMKIEQADISLANTLDTLRATGAGAGGATALANAALKSKQGVAASIESQEAQNEKLRAQGEQAMEQAQVAQQARLQDIQISEGARAQTAQAQGEAIKMQMTETREENQIDYVRGQLEAARQDQARAEADQTSGMMSAIGGIGGIVGGLAGGEGGLGSLFGGGS